MPQTIEISAPSAPTPTAKLFALGSDTVLYTASSVVEATNRNLYVCTFTGVALDTYLLVIYTAGTKFASRYVTINDDEGTFTEVNDPATSVIHSSFTFSPVDAAVRAQRGSLTRGDATPIRFVADPAAIIDDAYWSAYIGRSDEDEDLIEFSVALGNMEVDESTGVILLKPTSAQTRALPLGLNAVECELWRTGPGVHDECMVGWVVFEIRAGLRGAP